MKNTKVLVTDINLEEQAGIILSLTQKIEELTELKKEKLQEVRQLMEENNLKELAHLTMENVLKEKDLGVGYEFDIYDTDPSEATELFSI